MVSWLEIGVASTSHEGRTQQRGVHSRPPATDLRFTNIAKQNGSHRTPNEDAKLPFAADLQVVALCPRLRGPLAGPTTSPRKHHLTL
jgi:hypothetical protein